MKKIIITQRLIENASYAETRECLDIQYPKLIFNAGFIPIVLPYGVDFKHYFSELLIDGILLTGGNDLNCVQKNRLSSQRDHYETALVKYAISKKIPIFGICRGLQLIAQFFGSTLVPVSGQIGVYHSLNINADSQYKKQLAQLKKVNSYHNYAIKNLAVDLLASATTPDGVIKAIEHNKYPIFAQMWHSEREQPFIKNEVALIHSFFNEHGNNSLIHAGDV